MGCGCCSCGGGGGRGSTAARAAGLGLVLILLGAIGAAVVFGPPAKAPAATAHPPASASAQPASPAVEKPATPVSAYVLDHRTKRIDGTAETLDKYKGKVVLIVNVASKCGYTPQYEGLEKLYRDKKDAGLVVLGFPANNFRAQEPGTNKEIAEFCSTRFGVTFPMFEKISVVGPDQDPLYRQLAAQPAPIGGDPKWNFTKFLVDRGGNVVARFEPGVKPDDPDLVTKVDALLSARP